jgi:hypothetical protein
MRFTLAPHDGPALQTHRRRDCSMQKLESEQEPDQESGDLIGFRIVNLSRALTNPTAKAGLKLFGGFDIALTMGQERRSWEWLSHVCFAILTWVDVACESPPHCLHMGEVMRCNKSSVVNRVLRQLISTTLPNLQMCWQVGTAWLPCPVLIPLFVFGDTPCTAK